MTQPIFYPLRFEPIFKSPLWGGQRLPGFFNLPPSPKPVGEAWVLSDVEGDPSRVSDGPLAGKTLRELMAEHTRRILGPAKSVKGRFPLLLKFIDARQELSVQVHPNDEQAARSHPDGNGKTEAWVILDRNPSTSRIYAGFVPGMTAAEFRAALAVGKTPATLHAFTPEVGDCVFLEAGTVHAIGADILLFEVQQTSDITYRLYDWDRLDAATGKPRALHVDAALACSDFARGPCRPVTPQVDIREGVRWEKLVAGEFFTLERSHASSPFQVGETDRCRIVVCVAGRGELEWHTNRYPLATGSTYLLPAEVGACLCRPAGELTLLECGIPETDIRDQG